MSERSEQVKEIPAIPIKPGQTQWVKIGNEWVWETTYARMVASVVNEGSTREFLIDIRTEYKDRLHAIALLPKAVIEDLYKDLQRQEHTGCQCPVELDDDPNQTA